MSRFLIVFLIIFSTSAFAQKSDLNAQALVAEEAEFTEREYRIVELSGLVSLSDQAKVSAQHMIALSTVKAGGVVDNALVEINHAQHFGIAQNLSVRWAQAEWEKRLLVIIDSLNDSTQKKIEKELSKNILRAAQKKERAAINNQDKAEYSLYMNKLKQRPPAASRWKLVRSLDKQSSFSQLIIKTREQVYKEISSQVKGWQPPENWKEEARQEVLEFLFYAYRKTPNSELKKTANGYNSSALKSFLAKVKAEI